MKRDLAAVILAAGLGKRMKSDKPKVLHPVCERPMLEYVLDSIEPLGVKRLYVVVGHKGEMVAERIGNRGVCVFQREQLGTAHAVLQAKDALADFDGDVLISCGDTPLLTAKTLGALVEGRRRGSPSGVVLATRLEDPAGYGRIVRDAQGRALRIVEQKDASPEEAQIQEINTGVYCVDCRGLFDALARVRNENAQGEYYLTDIVGLFAAEGRFMDAVVAGDPSEVVGINSRRQLAEADRLMRLRWVGAHMDEGLTVVDPDTTFLSPEARFGRDAVIHPFSAVRGASEIGAEAQIGPGAEIQESTVGAGARVIHSWVEGAEIGAGAHVGPYSRIHPGAKVAPGARVASFAEIFA